MEHNYSNQENVTWWNIHSRRNGNSTYSQSTIITELTITDITDINLQRRNLRSQWEGCLRLGQSRKGNERSNNMETSGPKANLYARNKVHDCITHHVLNYSTTKLRTRSYLTEKAQPLEIYFHPSVGSTNLRATRCSWILVPSQPPVYSVDYEGISKDRQT